MAHVTRSECCGQSRLCKIALTVTLACLFAVVTAARGDEPAAAPAESKPTQAETAKAGAKPENPAAPAPDAAPATSQPESFDPAIIIETTPAIERSDAIRTVVEALEKERIAIRSDEDSVGKPIDFHAFINVRPDLSAQEIRELLDTLRKQSIGRISFSEGPADGLNRVVVNCPADVTWRRVRTLQEEIEKHKDFTFDIRVAANNTPVTPTLPPMPQFTDQRRAAHWASLGSGN